MVSHPSLIILGSGYTGRFLASLATRRYRDVFATSRQPEKLLNDVPTDRRIRYDLEQPDTWKDVPKQADMLWCFPPTPLDLVQKFSSTLDSPTRRIVVLGSTSAYELPARSHEYPPPWLDEAAPIDLSKPRVQGEEWLRKEHGAIVLRVAGIYGPGRNPLDWIGHGHVRPSRKYVNLIHVEDLAAMCLAALERGTPGEVYNVSDGQPRTWTDICTIAAQRWGIGSAAFDNGAATGKRISNAKLLAMLGADRSHIRHADLVRALQEIQDETITPSTRPLHSRTPADY